MFQFNEAEYIVDGKNELAVFLSETLLTQELIKTSWLAA
jgi:hypothetical protein